MIALLLLNHHQKRGNMPTINPKIPVAEHDLETVLAAFYESSDLTEHAIMAAERMCQAIAQYHEAEDEMFEYYSKQNQSAAESMENMRQAAEQLSDDFLTLKNRFNND